ncbi:MAG: hypothetical protein ACI9EQ_001907 [Bacteroidia bacterium]|jgi:hypothetical protein
MDEALLKSNRGFPFKWVFVLGCLIPMAFQIVIARIVYSQEGFGLGWLTLLVPATLAILFYYFIPNTKEITIQSESIQVRYRTGTATFSSNEIKEVYSKFEGVCSNGGMYGLGTLVLKKESLLGTKIHLFYQFGNFFRAKNKPNIIVVLQKKILHQKVDWNKIKTRRR